MASEHASRVRPARALLLVLVGLWSPFVVPFVLEDQRSWMLSHAVILPGLQVAMSLGEKASDWGLAAVVTGVMVVALFLLARRCPVVATVVSLLLGGLMAFGFYGLLQV